MAGAVGLRKAAKTASRPRERAIRVFPRPLTGLPTVRADFLRAEAGRDGEHLNVREAITRAAGPGTAHRELQRTAGDVLQAPGEPGAARGRQGAARGLRGGWVVCLFR
ncbi:hypothetical protein GCM10010363_68250 [Streptomyces omiyaensis]|nr:hypothetical protein GCM10010363_68250 [Streptomyces omiyaensis]